MKTRAHRRTDEGGEGIKTRRGRRRRRRKGTTQTPPPLPPPPRPSLQPPENSLVVLSIGAIVVPPQWVTPSIEGWERESVGGRGEEETPQVLPPFLSLSLSERSRETEREDH